MLALTGRPAAGSPGGSACACSPSRAAHAREPPPAVASGAELAPSCGYHRRDHLACIPSHPADQPVQPQRRGRRNPGPVEPHPPGTTAGQPGTTQCWNQAPGQRLSPPPY